MALHLCHSERQKRSLGAQTPAAKESGAGTALALVPAYQKPDARPPHQIPRRLAPRNDSPPAGAGGRSRKPAPPRRMNSAALVSAAAKFIARGSIPLWAVGS